MLHKESKKGR